LKLRPALGQEDAERIAVKFRGLVLEPRIEPPPLGVQLPIDVRGFVHAARLGGESREIRLLARGARSACDSMGSPRIHDAPLPPPARSRRGRVEQRTHDPSPCF